MCIRDSLRTGQEAKRFDPRLQLSTSRNRRNFANWQLTIDFRLVKERSSASSDGRGHNTPYSSVGSWRGLSRLRRYRIGNSTFVTIRGQGSLLEAADQLEATQK